MPSARTRLGLVATVALIGLGLAFAWSTQPHVPGNAASTVVAVVTPEGAIEPDAPTDAPPDELPTSPGGEACLDPLTLPAGSMSLCWEVVREGADTDPAHDYYRLRVHGTFQAPDWAVLRAGIVDPTGDSRIVEHWPSDDSEGPCAMIAPGGLPGSSDEGATDRCTLLLGAGLAGQGTRSSATWVCDGCDRSSAPDRQIELRQLVSVPEGARPSWELFADAGS